LIIWKVLVGMITIHQGGRMNEKLTRQELNYWLEDNWVDWLPDILLNMLNENKPHALVDLKHEIKDAWKQSREADDEEKTA